jgi:hypothetical protein
MQDQNNFVGNDVASPVDGTDGSQDSTEQKVNAGAIRKSTTQSLLTALSNASGNQFTSVEDALAWAARTGATVQKSDGNVQPVEQQPHQRNRTTTNDLAEQFQKLQSELARKDQIVREKDLDTEIQRAMGDRFDNDLLDYALTKVRSNILWNNDGTYSIVNNKGQERYSMDGTPLTIQGLVQEVAQGNPKLLKQSTLSSGSGLRPGTSFAGAAEEGIPDYSRDPAAFNAWAQRNGLGKRMGLKSMGVSASSSTTVKKLL